MNLTTAPSHVVSGGRVSCDTVPADRPHWETRFSKVIMIWSFKLALAFLGSLTGSAAHAFKGPARQSQSRTLLHTHALHVHLRLYAIHLW